MAVQTIKQSKGRHPLLKLGTLSNRVFLELKRKPGRSIRDISGTLLEDYQVVNGCMQRMKKAGLIATKPDQLGNRVVYNYYPVMENETGNARDTIRVDITVFVNEYGEYSTVSRIVGENPTAREFNPKPIHSVTHHVVVPKPTESFKTRMIFEDGFTGTSSGDKKFVVIEGEILDIKDK